jgi:hypothetical protein
MRRTALLFAFLFVAATASGCTAITDFGHFMFGPSDVDSGTGDGGGGGDGGVDAGPHDAGDVDVGPVDAGNDAGSDAGRDVGPRIPTGVVMTSGGAVITTSNYQLRVSVGAPEPVGQASSSSTRLRVGPQAR